MWRGSSLRQRPAGRLPSRWRARSSRICVRVSTARARQIQLVQNIFGADHQFGSLLNQPVGAHARSGGDVARHGEHVAPLFERLFRRQQRAAAGRSLDHHHAQRQAADRPVAYREILAFGRCTGWKLGHHRAVFHDICREMAVFGRIDRVDPAAHHGNSPPAGVQRGFVCRCIDAHAPARSQS